MCEHYVYVCNKQGTGNCTGCASTAIPLKLSHVSNDGKQRTAWLVTAASRPKSTGSLCESFTNLCFLRIGLQSVKQEQADGGHKNTPV